jgi:hypothetical protein
MNDRAVGDGAYVIQSRRSIGIESIVIACGDSWLSFVAAEVRAALIATVA